MSDAHEPRRRSTAELREFADEVRRNNQTTEFLDLLLEGASEASVRKHGPFGNIFARPMLFAKAGELVRGHTHNYDHVTIVTSGAVVVRAHLEGDESTLVERTYRAPTCILIKKDWRHEFRSLEDGTFAVCVYALRGFDGQVADDWNGDLTPYE